MKRTTDVGIGGKGFTLDEDAYARLESYLNAFKKKLAADQRGEVMDEIEARIAELLGTGFNGQVVSVGQIEAIIAQLGMPDGSEVKPNNNKNIGEKNMEKPRKLYRNSEDKKIGGVCSGIAAFFNIDVTLIRIIFLVALLAGTTGFWIYIVVWIVAPLAITPAQKCEMYGLPVTAENMFRFTNNQ